MPIPGVPTLDPVPLKKESPGEAGRPGEAVAQMGGVVEDVASTGLALEAHIREAQKQVDRMAASNQLDAAFTALQDDLAKTSNSRSVDEVLRSHQEAVNGIAKEWAKSPDAIQIQMMADSLHPGMAHHAQIRQIDLMGKEWEAQKNLQVDKLLPQYVAARRSGDTEGAKAIESHLSSSYDEAIRNGLKTDAEKTINMRAFGIAAQKDINEAAIMSPNPEERQAAITQLRKGGSGPLDMADMTPGERANLLTHAESEDQRLKNLSEARNLNGALDIWHNSTQTPELKGNFEAQTKVLEDGDWLVKHNIVNDDGKPDWVMAEKLSSQAVKDEEVRQKVQKDRDEKFLEANISKVDGTDVKQMTLADIDSLPDEAHGGVSNHARSVMKSAWNQTRVRAREEMATQRSIAAAERAQNSSERAQATADRANAKREAEDQSHDLAAQVALDITAGKVFEPIDIYGMEGLTHQDKLALIQENDKTGNLHNPYVKATGDRIRELPLQTSDQNQLFRLFLEQVKSGDLRGSQITQTADQLIERAKKRDASEWIEQTFSHLTTPGQITSRDRQVLSRSGRSATPEGFDVKVKGKDGKWYWGNSTTHELGGEAQ